MILIAYYMYFQPPGVGKTMIVKAVASECSSTLFSVSSAILQSKYVGDNENLVSILFAEARKLKPSIIFIDECDWICSTRPGSEKGGGKSHETNQKAELLAQMDGLRGSNEQVLVMGATNLPSNLDAAFLRRFEHRIYVPLPDLDARAAMFKKKLSSKQSVHCLTESNLTDLAARTENYNASDIDSIVLRAKMMGMYKLRAATNFMEVSEGYFTPCAPDEEGSVMMTIDDIHESKLVLPQISNASDFFCTMMIYFKVYFDFRKTS